MKTVTELKNYANTCHALAQKAVTEEDRRLLIEMANTWMLLAVTQERAQQRGQPQSATPFCSQIDRSPPH